MMLIVILFLILACLAFISFWIGKIFYITRKGLNEIIAGINSLDDRLSKIEQQMGN